MTDASDPPIVPMDYRFGVNVVDIGDARVARGRSRRVGAMCKHRNVVYDTHERRIWCEDCQSTIEAFDAFQMLVGNHDEAWQKIKTARAEIQEALQHHLTSRAAKEVDKIWRSMNYVPICKCCNRGLLPEDFAAGPSIISREIETARREKESKK